MIAICRLCGVQCSDDKPEECVGWLTLATGPREVPLFSLLSGETPPLRLCQGCVGFVERTIDARKVYTYLPAISHSVDDPILDD